MNKPIYVSQFTEETLFGGRLMFIKISVFIFALVSVYSD